MLPALWLTLRAYAPYVTFPFALVVGYIGYNIERRVREDRDRKLTYLHKSVREQREDRLRDEFSGGKNATTKSSTFVPPPTLEINPVGKNGGMLWLIELTENQAVLHFFAIFLES